MKLTCSKLNRLVILVVLGVFTCFSAYAAKQPWLNLTPMQHEALAPLAQEWDSMPEKQQKRLLATTKKYPNSRRTKNNAFNCA